MAINTPMGSTNIDRQDYSNPYNSAQAQSIADIIKGSALQGQQTANNENSEKLKSLLQGQQLDKQKEILDTIKSENPGAQAKVGELSVGVDPAVALQKKAMDATKHESDSLTKHFGSDAKDLEGAASQVESGLTGLNDKSPAGDKTAVAALTRLADGKGQRMTQAQLASMTPASAQGSVEKMMNYWSGAAESGLPDAQRQALAKLLTAHASRLKNEYTDSINQFKEQAPMFAPTLAASGQLAPFVNTFGQKGQAIFDRVDKLAASLPYNNPQVATAGPKAESEGLIPSALSKLSGLKALLMGSGGSPSAMAAPQGGGQPSAAPAPQQQAMPTGPSGFDPDAFLSGK